MRKIEQILSNVSDLFSLEEREEREMETFCQTVMVQLLTNNCNFYDLSFVFAQKTLTLLNLRKSFYRFLQKECYFSCIFSPSHVTGLPGCKFLLVLSRLLFSRDSFHQWGLRSGESSFLLCGTLGHHRGVRSSRCWRRSFFWWSHERCIPCPEETQQDKIHPVLQFWHYKRFCDFVPSSKSTVSC